MKIAALLCWLMSLPLLMPGNTGDYASLILGEWQRPDPEGDYHLYDKYVFDDKGQAVFSQLYIDDQELNIETRKYRISGNILIIELKKMIGRGNEYYRYKIISLTDRQMVLQLLSKYLRTGPETWVRPRNHNKSN